MVELNKPLFQCTLGDFVEAVSVVMKDKQFDTIVPSSSPKRLVYGIKGLANLLGCSISTANRIKASGEIDEAISQLNNVIVIDGDLALDLLRISKRYKKVVIKKKQK